MFGSLREPYLLKIIAWLYVLNICNCKYARFSRQQSGRTAPIPARLRNSADHDADADTGTVLLATGCESDSGRVVVFACVNGMTQLTINSSGAGGSLDLSKMYAQRHLQGTCVATIRHNLGDHTGAKCIYGYKLNGLSQTQVAAPCYRNAIRQGWTTCNGKPPAILRTDPIQNVDSIASHAKDANPTAKDAALDHSANQPDVKRIKVDHKQNPSTPRRVRQTCSWPDSPGVNLADCSPLCDSPTFNVSPSRMDALKQGAAALSSSSSSTPTSSPSGSDTSSSSSSSTGTTSSTPHSKPPPADNSPTSPNRIAADLQGCEGHMLDCSANADADRPLQLAAVPEDVHKMSTVCA